MFNKEFKERINYLINSGGYIADTAMYILEEQFPSEIVQKLDETVGRNDERFMDLLDEYHNPYMMLKRKYRLHIKKEFASSINDEDIYNFSIWFTCKNIDYIYGKNKQIYDKARSLESADLEKVCKRFEPLEYMVFASETGLFDDQNHIQELAKTDVEKHYINIVSRRVKECLEPQ